MLDDLAFEFGTATDKSMQTLLLVVANICTVVGSNVGRQTSLQHTGDRRLTDAWWPSLQCSRPADQGLTFPADTSPIAGCASVFYGRVSTEDEVSRAGWMQR